MRPQRIGGRVGTLVAMGMITRKLPKFRWFQSRPKTAWCCRWVLGSVAVLVILVWIVSFRVQAEAWAPAWGHVRVQPNGVVIRDDPMWPDGRSNMQVMGVTDFGTALVTADGPMSVYRRKWFDFTFRLRGPDTNQPQTRQWRIPLWPTAACVAVPALAAWRNRWVVNREIGTCHHCGYSRTGLAPSAPCPECGTAPKAPIAKS